MNVEAEATPAEPAPSNFSVAGLVTRFHRFFSRLKLSRAELIEDLMAQDIAAFDRENPHWDYQSRYDAALVAYKSGLDVETAEKLYDVSLSDQTEVTSNSDCAGS